MTLQLAGTTWNHPRGYDSVVAASELYARYFDVSITWTARSLQAFADEPLGGLANRFDLIILDHPHIAAAATAGLLAHLDDSGFDDQLGVLARHAVGSSHRSYTYGNHQYGLACDAAAQVGAHRPDQLAEVPTSFDEVLALARTGRVRWPLSPIDAYSSLLTLAANQGTPPMTRPEHFLDTEPLLATLDRMHQLAAFVPDEDVRHNPIDTAEVLCADNQWCYSPLLFGYTNYSRRGFRPYRLVYSDIPGIDGNVAGSLLGGAGVAVSASSRHVQQAREFAFWLCSAPVQRGVYFEAGGQPGHAAAWEDTALDAAASAFFTGTRKTLDEAYVRPQFPRYVQFQDRVSPWVTQNLQHDIDDQQLAARLNSAAAELLTEKAR